MALVANEKDAVDLFREARLPGIDALLFGEGVAECDLRPAALAGDKVLQPGNDALRPELTGPIKAGLIRLQQGDYPGVHAALGRSRGRSAFGRRNLVRAVGAELSVSRRGARFQGTR